MDFVTFAVCLTVIIAIILYAYHETQEKTSKRVESMYGKALAFQQSVLQEIRLIRSQEQTERAQMAAERVNVMGTVNHLITELRREKAIQDEQVRNLIERLRIDLVQCVGDAAAHAMGQVKGEPVLVMEDVQGASSEDEVVDTSKVGG